jgi:ribosomal protein S18 acetylase RimI-like enzyme
MNIVYVCAVLGKAEGRGKLWHGHVSAVTVNPEFRRIGLAASLMGELERISRDMWVSSHPLCNVSPAHQRASQI